MITDRTSAVEVTADDVRDLIASGQQESNELEFKRNDDADLIKAACAVANFGGGFILVGIDEDAQHRAGSIVNVENVHRVVDSIRQRLRDGLTPRPVLEVVPLVVDDANVVVIRVAPQGPPHMVSADKRTDFYGRYAATSEKMRYDEIERHFLNRPVPADVSSSTTPTVTIQTMLGRRDISIGAAGALDETKRLLSQSDRAELSFIAVSDGNVGSLSEPEAILAFNDPTYVRRSGWLVVRPGQAAEFQDGAWVQNFGRLGALSVNASGDALFRKTVDDTLCWNQSPEDFARSPRLYSNTLIEFCLSFCYFTSDIAVSTKPRRLMLVPTLRNASGTRLPLGEAGSVWFDAPLTPPHRVEGDWLAGTTIFAEVETGRPINIRRLAFQLAAQVYGLFGYSEKKVPFADNAELTFQGSTIDGALSTARGFVQGVLSTRLFRPREDFRTRSWLLDAEYLGKSRVVAFSHDMLNDLAPDEAQLNKLIDADQLRELFATHDHINITTFGVGAS